MAATLPQQGRAVVAEFGVLRTIIVDSGVTSVPVEASGIIHAADIGAGIVVSDETYKKRPELFIMDSTGRISASAVVTGMETINDIEGIAEDAHGCCYLLASQSYNRSGERSDARRLLVRCRRSGQKFTADKSVSLADRLHDAAFAARTMPWAEFILGDSSANAIDIEGITVMHDTLLLGFKNPKRDGNAVILAIADPGVMFDHNRIAPEQLSLWAAPALRDPATGTQCGVSDLCFRGDVLYGVATGTAAGEKDIGLFWEYTPSNRSLRVLRSFPGLKPEGIAYNGALSAFCIVFDNGSRHPSQVMTAKVPQ
jgi:hypothetical protein